jgi:chitinase
MKSMTRSQPVSLTGDAGTSPARCPYIVEAQRKPPIFTRMKTLYFFILLTTTIRAYAQPNKDLTIIAYYSGGPAQVDSLPAEKLTHIIFSFGHLKGNNLSIGSRRDSTTIKKLVQLKKRNSQLKIILSLGGWGGCETCSNVFSSEAARQQFSESVRKLRDYFHVDGLDLDWEYPAIQGYPGHAYKPEDKQNFTALLSQLRNTLGPNFELSFAAGGFQKFIDESIDWKPVMELVDRVNVMTYDLVHGYSTETGHHTALYSNPKQKESTDNAVQSLIKLGVPRNKIVIGAAFYARVWENVAPTNNGLYQAGKFKMGIDYKKFNTGLKGFQLYWDDTSQSPYAYNASEKLFATFDDKRSIELKTKYALNQKLDGIMFWELSLDSDQNGLVDTMYQVKVGHK